MNNASNKPKVRHQTVSSDQAGQRLDNFLIGQLGGVPRSLVYRLIRTGQVRVNGGRAKPMKKLRPGDQVRIPPVSAEPAAEREVPAELLEEIRDRILYRDDDIAVIDKPAGLAMHGGSGISAGLMDVLARIDADFRPVHRLDRSTSGLVVVARNRLAAVELQHAFRSHSVDKRYLALLSGLLREDAVTVDQPLKKIRDASGQHRVIVAEDGQSAITHFRVLERFGNFTFAEVVIETGRTHQIRAHAAWMAHPLAGDDRYNRDQPPPGLKRLFLHAHCLSLPWPEQRLFNAPLPEALARVLDNLRESCNTET